MDKFEEDKFNPQDAEEMLEKINLELNPYIDSDDIIDACEYLYANQRLDDVDTLTSYGLTLHPETPEIMIIRAKMCVDSTRIPEAEALINKLVELDVEDPDFYIVRGWFHLRQGEIDMALNYFNKAVELDVNDFGIEFEIGLNLNQFCYHKDAIKYLEHFLKSHPDDPECMFELAFAYEKVGKITESITLYEDLVDKSPFFESAWYNLGILYSNTDQFDKALMAYDTAVTINPEYPEPYYNMGNTYMILSRYEDAIVSYTDYAVLCDTDGLKSVYCNLGECWWELGDIDMSKRFYKKAVDSYPGRADLMYGYALCCIEQSNNIEGIEWLNKAKKLQPNNPDINFAMAQAYYSMMQKDNALSELMIGLKKDSEVILAWNEALKLFIAVDDSHSPFLFIENNSRRFGKSNSFRFIHAYVIYKYGYDTTQAVKMLEKIVKTDRQVIYNAAEDDELRRMLKVEQVAEMLTKYNITIEDPI